MERIKLKTFILLFLSSLSFLLTQRVSACSDYYISEWNSQTTLFRAMLPDMVNMRPFMYTSSFTYYPQPEGWGIYTDPHQSDRYINCSEWLSQCDKSVSIDDIYKIQYDTDGTDFVKSREQNTLDEDFRENTLVAFLLKKENKDLLDYMTFAKQMETTELLITGSRFEEWDNYYYYHNYEEDRIHSEKQKLYAIAQHRISETKSDFLKERYAFQLCRLVYQLKDYSNARTIYKNYFSEPDPDRLMNIWASLFYALSIDAIGLKEEANRIFALVFDYSNEKKARCVQMFNPEEPMPDSFTAKEKGLVTTMQALRNPGRALDQLQHIDSLDKKNKHLPFLVLREINKLEEWLRTPLFYSKRMLYGGESYNCNKETTEQNNYEQIAEENQITDMEYLTSFKSFLTTLFSGARNETGDFYAIALAHLSLLQENYAEAKQYINKVSPEVNPTIQLQKQIETAWISIKTENITGKKFQEDFIRNIQDLQKISNPYYDSEKILYTLTLSLADQYLKRGNRVTGNLMRLKSDQYQLGEEHWRYEFPEQNAYFTIAYFDENGTCADMDTLITLLEKKNRSSFEQYLCNQPLGSVNAYKNLKGTLAFRNNDLKTAYAAFSSIPPEYWKEEPFASYLNEDPFKPKGLGKNKDRRFDYAFNKAEFVKKIMDLQQQAEKNKSLEAESYLELGNAYFNTSHWGNAWMMNSYEWSGSDPYYRLTPCTPQWMEDYLTANPAKKYYEKALKTASNNEQQAYASVMLHIINRNLFACLESEEYLKKAVQYKNDFMNQRQTQTFKQYECPGITHFLASTISSDE